MASDTMAVGALATLREAGLRVPEDVAVVGFDGLEGPLREQPTLTTVAQPIGGLGRAAIELLLGAIEDPGAPVASRLLPTRLLRRGSCGCRDEAEAGAEAAGGWSERPDGATGGQPADGGGGEVRPVC